MEHNTHDAVQAALNDILDQHFTQPVNLWPRLQRQLAPRPPRPMRRRWTWQVGLITGLLVLAVTAYAVNSLLKQALSEDQGLVHVAEQGLGQEVAVEQSTDDTLLKLEWVYADSNRISLGYTLTMLDGTVIVGDAFPQPRTYLMDDQGHLFQESYTRHSREDTRVAYVQNFDTSNLKSLPETLNLRFVGSFEELSSPTQRFLGPFNLHFSLATTTARRLAAPLTLEVNGRPLTLSSVVTTPSMTRMELCYDNIASWQVSSTLSLGDERQAIVPAFQASDMNCQTWIYDVSLYETQGAWTLTVDEMVDYWGPLYETPDLFERFRQGEDFDSILAALDERGLIKRITGPFTFTFTLDS